MDSTFLNCYIFISILIALIDIVLAVKSFQKNPTTGLFLGIACLCAAVVDVSYLICILQDNYLFMSIMSSIYFVTIDLMLVSLLVFTVYFTKEKFSKGGKIVLRLICLYTIFEIVAFAINPFREIAISYVWRDTFMAKYDYEMHPLYVMHLIFTYAMVATVVILMIRKMCRIPREYRAQYRHVILGILTIVAVNGLFLFAPDTKIYTLLDYSICGYSLTAFLLYWSCFNYSTHGMLNGLKTSIFESIGQGIVLFDYDDQLILHNERADSLLGGIDPKQCAALKDFSAYYDLPLETENAGDSFSLQCYIQTGESLRPLRCDIRRLRNEKAQQLGQLFVFSDAALETDLLTGFQNWDSFQRFSAEHGEQFGHPAAVAVCDINSLSVINSTLGNQVGDQKIRLLADTMRQYFPKQAYYVRGREATLIAVCSFSSEAGMQTCMQQVDTHFPGKIQYAFSTITVENPDVLQAIQTAEKSMRAKKLLDQESIHSEMLTSLIRALQECDSDTEHHVRRTQRMGAELGKRIGLSDLQQSRLSLLCLLHDIGKIGIPLEILNKPGKLSEEEWAILRSHAVKGYEIANSNNELKEIAEDILHHHERWDGGGYPDGLSRESIPLLSRVIAVVDAFDAMTNDRAYRPAMPVSQAIEELKRCAGSQFDPFIVSEFLQMLKDTPSYAEVVQEKGETSPALLTAESENTDTDEDADNQGLHLVSYSRYLLDDANRIVSIDENFEIMTGYTQEDIRQKPLYQVDLIPEEDRTEYLCFVSSHLAKNPLLFLEHKLLRKDGSRLYVFCYGRVYYDSAVRSRRSEIIITDVSSTYSMKMLTDAEQTKAQTRLRYWESTYRRDSLTGLLNHAAFRSDVEQKLLEGGCRYLMMMMDLDHFKEYNDTYGHHNGDQFLILAAQALMASVKEGDRACRMGGDEFAVMIFFDPNVTEQQIRERARQIFDKVSMTIKSSDKKTGISMGAVIGEGETSFTRLYEAADKALYQAKENGRGRLVIS